VANSSPSQPAADVLERLVQLYGDLLFDLCESVLWSPVNAQTAFRAIVKDLKRSAAAHSYVNYERAWVLRTACARLVDLVRRHGRRLSPAEQVMLDSTRGSAERLRQFDSYFHRLVTDEQLVLLLRDKYGLPYAEISAALGIPEGTLKLRRQQALRTLEGWLWETA
jgi:RNA polymerase sigma factor (sigma-70 family)